MDKFKEIRYKWKSLILTLVKDFHAKKNQKSKQNLWNFFDLVCLENIWKRLPLIKLWARYFKKCVQEKFFNFFMVLLVDFRWRSIQQGHGWLQSVSAETKLKHTISFGGSSFCTIFYTQKMFYWCNLPGLLTCISWSQSPAGIKIFEIPGYE